MEPEYVPELFPTMAEQERPVTRPKYPELDREMLVKVVDHALSAENWRQTVWFMNNAETACGTAMCIAGFAAIEFAGWKPIYDRGMKSAVWCENETGYSHPIFAVARDFLGLTKDEADDLFYSGHRADEVRRITEAILGGEYRS